MDQNIITEINAMKEEIKNLKQTIAVLCSSHENYRGGCFNGCHCKIKICPNSERWFKTEGMGMGMGGGLGSMGSMGGGLGSGFDYGMK